MRPIQQIVRSLRRVARAMDGTFDGMLKRGVVAMAIDDDDGKAFRLGAILAAARGDAGK